MPMYTWSHSPHIKCTMYQNQHNIKKTVQNTHEIKSHKNKDIIFDKQKATPPVYGY